MILAALIRGAQGLWTRWRVKFGKYGAKYEKIRRPHVRPMWKTRARGGGGSLEPAYKKAVFRGQHQCLFGGVRGHLGASGLDRGLGALGLPGQLQHLHHRQHQLTD